MSKDNVYDEDSDEITIICNTDSDEDYIDVFKTGLFPHYHSRQVSDNLEYLDNNRTNDSIFEPYVHLQSVQESISLQESIEQEQELKLQDDPLEVTNEDNYTLHEDTLNNYERIGRNIISPKNLWHIAPIVGEYDQNEGKIKITGSYNIGDIDIFIIYQENDNKYVKTFSVKERKLFTIYLDNLKPNKEYKVNWYIRSSYICIFRHVIKTGKLDKILFVSCDMPETEVKDSIWTRIDNCINNGMKNRPITIMHIGNQIYGDKIYNKCLDENIINENTITQMYLDRYANTFIPHYYSLANAHNIMTWNDHDITSNIVCDLITSNKEVPILKGAKNAYKLVQENLHTKVTFVKDKCWVKLLEDNLTCIVIETITSDITIDLIIAIIELAIKKYNSNKMIIIFSSTPLPKPKGKSGYLYNKFYGNNKFLPKDELRMLYEYILDWIEVDRFNRDVIITGGDLKFGCIGTVMRNETQFTIFSASPVTAQPGIESVLACIGIKGVHNIGGAIKLYINDDQTKARRCYVELFLGTNSCNKLIPTIHYSNNILPKNIWSLFKT